MAGTPGAGSSRRVGRRVRVTGRVQGVFYRDSLRRGAERLGVAGWVRNRPDGSVESLLEGDEAAVAELLAWCRVGPPRARVEAVEVYEVDPVGLGGFSVR